jgi:1-acyl-sn-glycerol-3-phosphate acyltransferase
LPNLDRERLRAHWRVALIAFLLILYLPLHGLWRLLARRSPWPTVFLRRAGHAAGVDVRVTGTAVRHDVLLVANHLSWLDILILAGASGTRFVAADEVARWPIVGFLSGLNRTVYVSRRQRAEVSAQVDLLRSALAQGQPVTLFPEGGTGEGRVLRTFRASLLSALFPPMPGLVVQPVAIDYGADIPSLIWRDTSMGTEMMRVLGLAGRRTAVIRFLDPISLTETSDRKAVARETRDRIAEALGLNA